LVILCIVAIIARFAVPLLFPRQWRAADRAIMRALGLPDEARFVIAFALVLGVLVYGIIRACQYWRQRWYARRSMLQLPRRHGRTKA
jgi:uncharacterized protein YjeT (DUF2065 family)